MKVRRSQVHTVKKRTGNVKGGIQGDNHSFALLKNEGKCERETFSGSHC